MSAHSPATVAAEPPFLAGDPALDLMNTVINIDGVPVDTLQSDADVLAWLDRAGMAPPQAMPQFAHGALLSAAHMLRAVIRSLVTGRKAGHHADPAPLNAFLAETSTHTALLWSAGAAPRLEQRRAYRTPQQLLGPVAEAAAALIATADFTLVRPCEGEACVLWFHDTTKSHHRRWCSTAACGNRHKVSAFRKRRAQQGKGE